MAQFGLKGLDVHVTPQHTSGIGQPEKVEIPGAYYLDWRPDGRSGKRLTEPVGTSARVALRETPLAP